MSDHARRISNQCATFSVHLSMHSHFRYDAKTHGEHGSHHSQRRRASLSHCSDMQKDFQQQFRCNIKAHPSDAHRKRTNVASRPHFAKNNCLSFKHIRISLLHQSSVRNLGWGIRGRSHRRNTALMLSRAGQFLLACPNLVFTN